MKKKIVNKKLIFIAFILLFSQVINAYGKVSESYRTGGKQGIDASNIKWRNSTDQDILGGASDFNALLFESIENIDSLSGPVASREIKNIKKITHKENQKATSNNKNKNTLPKFNVAILTKSIVADSKNDTKTENGDIIINKNILENLEILKVSEGKIIGKEEEVIENYFIKAQEDMEALNKNLWEMQPVTDSKNIIKENNIITINLSEGDNIVDLGNLLNDFSGTLAFKYNTLPNRVIIKVGEESGENIDLSIDSMSINSKKNPDDTNLYNRIVWVFNPEIENIKIKKSKIHGNILATKANIELIDGKTTISGTVVANKLVGKGNNNNSELYYICNSNGPGEDLGKDESEENSKEDESEDNSGDELEDNSKEDESEDNSKEDESEDNSKEDGIEDNSEEDASSENSVEDDEFENNNDIEDIENEDVENEVDNKDQGYKNDGGEVDQGSVDKNKDGNIEKNEDNKDELEKSKDSIIDNSNIEQNKSTYDKDTLNKDKNKETIEEIDLEKENIVEKNNKDKELDNKELLPATGYDDSFDVLNIIGIIFLIYGLLNIVKENKRK